MRILLVTHIGETLGHLIRGLSIAAALQARGIAVEIACSTKAIDFVNFRRGPYKMHGVRWDWSHNSCEYDGPSAELLSRICESVADLRGLLERCRPDAIIGMPGIITAQLAKHLEIPHFAIMHGPYLAPITKVANGSDAGVQVLARAKEMCDVPVNTVLNSIATAFDLPALSYSEFLRSELIFCPQPGLEFVREYRNIRTTSFVPGTLPGYPEPQVASGVCYVSFGSGNPCDLLRIVRLTSDIFPNVIVSSGKTLVSTDCAGVTIRPYHDDRSLAGRVSAVVCHGGIGTVGTFAAFGTPLLIVPTELDQAVMAVHACNLGIAEECGLESVAARSRPGRTLPHFSDADFLSALRKLKKQKSQTKVNCNGDAEIAEWINNHSYNLSAGAAEFPRPN